MASITGQVLRPVAFQQARHQVAPKAAFSRPQIRSRSTSIRTRQQQLRFVKAAASQDVSTEPAGPVNDSSFEELVLKAEVPVLVDFWAPWCGPCRMISGTVDELAVEFEGKLKVYKLNTDESPGVAAEYGIRSIPTIMFFKGGQKMDTVIGAVPKTTLKQTIEKYIE